MSTLIDRTGQRYGKLVVLAQAPIPSSSHAAFWLCRCDCGTEKVVRAHSLANGDTQSCGCSKKSRQTRKDPRELALFAGLIGHLVRAHKNTGLPYGEILAKILRDESGKGKRGPLRYMPKRGVETR